MEPKVCMAPVYKGMLVYILVYQLRDRVNVWHEDATLGHANFKTAALYFAYKGLEGFKDCPWWSKNVKIIGDGHFNYTPTVFDLSGTPLIKLNFCTLAET